MRCLHGYLEKSEVLNRKRVSYIETIRLIFRAFKKQLTKYVKLSFNLPKRILTNTKQTNFTRTSSDIASSPSPNNFKSWRTPPASQQIKADLVTDIITRLQLLNWKDHLPPLKNQPCSKSRNVMDNTMNSTAKLKKYKP